MHDVVVIGGGITGLAAAWELRHLGADYMLIEVKSRLGGSIVTYNNDGWCLDGGPFVFEKFGDWPWLSDLGLTNALTSIGRYRDGELVIFKRGSQTLVDALAQSGMNRVLLRMAVSSVGVMRDGCLGVCLENGVMLGARAVVLAAPARYAAHILRTLSPEASLLLQDYRYDPVARVSLGYQNQAVPNTMPALTGGLIKFVERYDLPDRVPSGHTLIRVGVRLDSDPAVPTPDAALVIARGLFAAAPVMETVNFWPEADPLTRYLPEHSAAMAMIETQLPASMALAGSDYRARRLNEQIEHGIAAARRMLHRVTTKSVPPT